MLIRLTPEQIAKFWVLIKTALIEATPPTMRMTDALVINTLSRLLVGSMQAWVAVERLPAFAVKGICLTCIQPNELDCTKTLLIFCAYTFGTMYPAAWQECLLHMQKYAKAEECRSITFYSGNPDITKITKQLGFLTEYTYGVFDV